MKLKQYDNIVLKDGREGCIVEVWSADTFEVDIGTSEKDWDTITVKLEQIERKQED